METLLLSPPEIPGKTRPPITLRPTWVRLSSDITADTCSEEEHQTPTHLSKIPSDVFHSGEARQWGTGVYHQKLTSSYPDNSQYVLHKIAYV